MIVGDLLSRLITRLDAAGIPHMVTGSFASTFHGMPRTTHDIDLVIDPTRASLDAFVGSLPEAEYYVDIQTARDALHDRTQFNVIDLASGWKVDLIIRKDRSFSEAEFARRLPAEIAGTHVFVATAEDTILAKLEWSVLAGGSERQIRDIQGILQVRLESLDRSYVERWLRPLGVADLWREVTSAGDE